MPTPPCGARLRRGPWGRRAPETRGEGSAMNGASGTSFFHIPPWRLSHVRTQVTVDWKRETPDFAYQSYNRDHDWGFDAGITVRASPHLPTWAMNALIPRSRSSPGLSSCHMLTFLAIACKKRFTVDGYRDEAVGILGRIGGKVGHDRVTLRPQVRFGGREDTDAGGTGADARTGPPRLLHRQLGEDRGRRGAAVSCWDEASRGDWSAGLRTDVRQIHPPIQAQGNRRGVRPPRSPAARSPLQHRTESPCGSRPVRPERGLTQARFA